LLGKLAEEAGELAARAARCIIHGLNERDPDSRRTNRVELEREMSDVLAAIVAMEIVNVHADPDRADRKLDGFQRWVELIKASRG
jgi:hypothetical protein